MLPSTVLALSLVIASALALPQAKPRTDARSGRRTARRVSAHARHVQSPFGVSATTAAPSTEGNSSQRYDLYDGQDWYELEKGANAGVDLNPGDVTGWRKHGKNNTEVLITVCPCH
jgi:hypothetical protein